MSANSIFSVHNTEENSRNLLFRDCTLGKDFIFIEDMVRHLDLQKIFQFRMTKSVSTSLRLFFKFGNKKIFFFLFLLSEVTFYDNFPPGVSIW